MCFYQETERHAAIAAKPNSQISGETRTGDWILDAEADQIIFRFHENDGQTFAGATLQKLCIVRIYRLLCFQ